MNKEYEDLVCPIGKFPLKQSGNLLVCPNCNASFPIVDNVAMLLTGNAILPEGVNSIQDLKCYSNKK